MSKARLRLQNLEIESSSSNLKAGLMISTVAIDAVIATM